MSNAQNYKIIETYNQRFNEIREKALSANSPEEAHKILQSGQYLAGQYYRQLEKMGNKFGQIGYEAKVVR